MTWFYLSAFLCLGTLGYGFFADISGDQKTHALLYSIIMLQIFIDERNKIK